MNETLKQLLLDHNTGLSDRSVEGVLQFYDLVVKENEIQNLTRLVSPSDFFYGHVQDVLELLKLRWIDYPALDIGSGVGIPGIMAALLEKGQWVLAESERRKAEYLENTVHKLLLSQQVLVFSGRGETYLKSHSQSSGANSAVKSVVARAVGPVERIYSWIRGCSTWNSLLLFKGPNWDEEWKLFQNSKFKHELKIGEEHLYTTGQEGDLKTRKIIKIGRISR